MFTDASALTAMLCEEDDAAALLRTLEGSAVRITSPLAVWETALATARILQLDIDGTREAVEQFLDLARIEVRAVPAKAHVLALETYDRLGKSRHPAALNFGDCFAYACARLANMPLLYKGNDFAQTDIDAA
jgi:ribonuclease VapC